MVNFDLEICLSERKLNLTFDKYHCASVARIEKKIQKKDMCIVENQYTTIYDYFIYSILFFYKVEFLIIFFNNPVGR